MFKQILVIAAAVAAGVLIAPKSGSDTRKDMKYNFDKKYKEFQSQIKERLKRK